MFYIVYHRVLRTVHYAITPSATDRHQGKNHGLKINGRKKQKKTKLFSKARLSYGCSLERRKTLLITNNFIIDKTDHKSYSFFFVKYIAFETCPYLGCS